MDQEAWLALCGGPQATKKLHSVFWADFLIKYFPDVCPNQTDIMKQIAADSLLSTPRQLYSKVLRCANSPHASLTVALRQACT